MAYWVVVGCAIAALASRIETELSCTSCVCYSYYYTNFHHSLVLANEVTNGGIYHSCQSSCIFQGNYLFSSISASVIVLLVQGVRYQVGDVVSILGDDGLVYYCLLRGFLRDQYGQLSAALTWLLPKIPSPSCFDPMNFILG